jgi:hypothetical protein
MIFTITEQAEPHTVFAATAFDSQIGKTIPIKFGAGQADGKLVAAEVAEDGGSVTLTVEVETPPPLDPRALGLPNMSIGYRQRRDD